MTKLLEASVVRIFASPGGAVRGTVLQGDAGIALSCSHVVAGAVGLVETPPAPPEQPVTLDSPLVAPEGWTTSQGACWVEVELGGSGAITVLRLAVATVLDPDHQLTRDKRLVSGADPGINRLSGNAPDPDGKPVPPQTSVLLPGSMAPDALPPGACHIKDPGVNQPILTDQRDMTRPGKQEQFFVPSGPMKHQGEMLNHRARRSFSLVSRARRKFDLLRIGGNGMGFRPQRKSELEGRGLARAFACLATRPEFGLDLLVLLACAFSAVAARGFESLARYHLLWLASRGRGRKRGGHRPTRSCFSPSRATRAWNRQTR